MCILYWLLTINIYVTGLSFKFSSWRKTKMILQDVHILLRCCSLIPLRSTQFISSPPPLIHTAGRRTGLMAGTAPTRAPHSLKRYCRLSNQTNLVSHIHTIFFKIRASPSQQWLGRFCFSISRIFPATFARHLPPKFGRHVVFSSPISTFSRVQYQAIWLEICKKNRLHTINVYRKTIGDSCVKFIFL